MLAAIQSMSIEQKLQAMEQLWDDLRARAGDALSPSWHGDVLTEREAALQRGEQTSEDWADARERIRKTLG
jgi:hypothetical protein